MHSKHKKDPPPNIFSTIIIMCSLHLNTLIDLFHKIMHTSKQTYNNLFPNDSFAIFKEPWTTNSTFTSQRVYRNHEKFSKHTYSLHANVCTSKTLFSSLGTLKAKRYLTTDYCVKPAYPNHLLFRSITFSLLLKCSK